MRPPKLDEKPVPVVGTEHLSALLKACAGKGFEPRRDLAIIRVFIDTGIRAGEMAGLRVQDVDLDRRALLVTGKGRRTRGVGLGASVPLEVGACLPSRVHLHLRMRGAVARCPYYSDDVHVLVGLPTPLAFAAARGAELYEEIRLAGDRPARKQG